MATIQVKVGTTGVYSELEILEAKQMLLHF